MRTIDVDEAIINSGFEWDDIPPTREEFVRFLKKQPTVDAVPVVRCWECKYRDGTPGQPNILCGQMHEDDFCSYGERKGSAD